MIEIYFFAFLVFINLVCLIINIKRNYAFGGMFSFICLGITFASLILTITQTPSQEDVYRKVKEYEELKSQVEIAKNFKDPGIKSIFIPDLREKVQKMNDEILENRFRYDSKWSGHKYSKEIGELEELEMP